MKRRWVQIAFRLPALAAVWTLLVITTAAAAPGLFHGDHLDHCCEFCHLGHLPILKPAARVVFHTPAMLVSAIGSERAPQSAYHSLDTQPARAPPA